MPIFAAAVLILPGGTSKDLISRLNRELAASLERGLPDRPFAPWLRELLPPGAVPVYHIGPCSGAEGECLIVEAEITSRARILRLEFDAEGLRFRGGRLDAPDAEHPLVLERLSELPDRLTDPIRLEPVQCPNGARAKLRESYAGLHVWCENAAGRKHGPARSWFSTGRYLMSRGRYKNGERIGEWIECSRFEHCRVRHYD